MEWTTAMEQIFDELSEIFERSGKGSIQAAEEELAVYDGFFRKSRNRRRLDLPRLLQLLDALGMEPGEFFCRAFEDRVSGRNPTAVFDQITASHSLFSHENHEINKVLQARSFEETGTLSAVHQRHLQRHESILFDEPGFVANSARQMAYEGIMIHNLSLLLRSASLWASAYAYLEELDLARLVLHRAVRLSQDHNHETSLPNLFLRQSQLAIQTGEAQASWSFAMEAIKSFSYIGLPAGICKALVLASVAKSLLGHDEDARFHLQAASNFLPTEADPRPRFLIAIESARQACLRHELDIAKQHLQEAKAHLDDNLRRGRAPGFLLWMQARITASEGSREEVEKRYQAAYDHFAMIPRFRLRIARELEEVLATDEALLNSSTASGSALPLSFDRSEEPLPNFLIPELIHRYLSNPDPALQEI